VRFRLEKILSQWQTLRRHGRAKAKKKSQDRKRKKKNKEGTVQGEEEAT